MAGLFVAHAPGDEPLAGVLCDALMEFAPLPLPLSGPAAPLRFGGGFLLVLLWSPAAAARGLGARFAELAASSATRVVVLRSEAEPPAELAALRLITGDAAMSPAELRSFVRKAKFRARILTPLPRPDDRASGPYSRKRREGVDSALRSPRKKMRNAFLKGLARGLLSGSVIAAGAYAVCAVSNGPVRERLAASVVAATENILSGRPRSRAASEGGAFVRLDREARFIRSRARFDKAVSSDRLRTADTDLAAAQRNTAPMFARLVGLARQGVGQPAAPILPRATALSTPVPASDVANQDRRGGSGFVSPVQGPIPLSGAERDEVSSKTSASL